MATHHHTFHDNYPARLLKAENGILLDSSKETFSFSFKHA
jgi:hypothetical protein